ncbi:MAG: DUF4430 domain-containing protein [Candidatus Micrarchaeota archaeon]|nr:DUF4430 domain-containing protein [Candidatus Micrarchaeota archaeon]
MPFATAGVPEALSWLKASQQPDGSYGAWAEHQAAAAAMGMFLAEGNSTNSTAAFAWLRAQLENPASWFWGSWGEADVPAASLYAFSQANESVNYPITTPLLLSFQPVAGFKGYYDTAVWSSVESSVDTALALMAAAGIMPAQNKTAAVGFLLSLQNPDGSFNLTATVAEAPIYSLGPDKASATALAVLALNAANYSGNATQAAVQFLRNESASCFGNSNKSYAAAAAAIALAESNETGSAKTATKYLLSLQKPDGGFADASRSNPNASNALDTGWATAALAKADPAGYSGSCNAAPSPTPTPAPQYCGDGACNNGETCSSCPGDCGACSPPSSPSTVIIKVTFPDGSGKPNVNQAVPLSSCATALACFQQAASITCKNYPATGPLACQGHPETTESCFVSAVNGYAGAMGWWVLYVNGAPSAVGVSCYRPAANDAIELRYSTAAAAVDSTPAPATTPVPTATTLPSTSPAPAPTQAATAQPTTAKSPALQENSTGGKEFGQDLGAGKGGSAGEANQTLPAPKPPALISTGFFTAQNAPALLIAAACIAAFAAAAIYLRKREAG